MEKHNIEIIPDMVPSVWVQIYYGLYAARAMSSGMTFMYLHQVPAWMQANSGVMIVNITPA